jgi:hypothetical protein
MGRGREGEREKESKMERGRDIGKGERVCARQRVHL